MTDITIEHIQKRVKLPVTLDHVTAVASSYVGLDKDYPNPLDKANYLIDICEQPLPEDHGVFDTLARLFTHHLEEHFAHHGKGATFEFDPTRENEAVTKVILDATMTKANFFASESDDGQIVLATVIDGRPQRIKFKNRFAILALAMKFNTLPFTKQIEERFSSPSFR